MTDDRELPAALREVAAIGFDYRDGDGVDFEPYQHFLSAEETTAELRAITGDPVADGARLRIFGQDGTGGKAAFWLVRDGRPIAEQPVVFFGSEGENGVVAVDLASYLWLLADGSGPFEAAVYGGESGVPDPALTEVATRYAPQARRSAPEVVAAATAEFPDFVATVDSWCR